MINDIKLMKNENKVRYGLAINLHIYPTMGEKIEYTHKPMAKK